uniref:Receptor-like kinase TMK4 n=1 Tax=Tanacetum cinerariifolium TaxID=118510 RepID=A0A699I1V2_TANCI|nr:receptor-like kinase TMK4 [Tanacetum cinerariifolium]
MTILIHHTTFLLLTTTTTTADDGAVMSILSSSISPTPFTWKTKTHYCSWQGISCDNTHHVTSIDLPSLSLTGTLPPDLNNLSSLIKLDVQKNMLLETFSISDNLDLAPWVIPDTIANTSFLKSFLASNANIYGTIPDVFDNLSLVELKLSYNNLTSELPLSLGKSYIAFLWLNNQMMGLSGGIDVLGSMVEISQADNMLTGFVPLKITRIPDLANVSLQNNKLQGPVPVFESGVKVELGEFGSNSFCLDKPGDCDYQVSMLLEIVGELGYPLSLAEYWKGNDACARWEFVSYDANKNVTGVNFAKQNFSGTISPDFGNLTSLRSISLDGNNFVGPIPKVLTSLKDLQLLDVSRNNLSGTVPAFSPKVKFVYDNNIFLGVNISNLSPPPRPMSNISPSSGSLAKRSKRSSRSVGLVIGIVVSVLLFVEIVLFVSYQCYMKHKYQKFGRVGSRESGKKLVPESVLGSSSNRYGKEMLVKESVAGSSANRYGVFSELQSQSSGDHCEMHVFEVGRGGFGVVYKGELHDGMEISVKGTKGMNEFQAEIRVLTKDRHRHLIALLGYCTNVNEILLVYEYIPKGTLSQHLFYLCENNSQPLSWKQRVLIALDVGRGVGDFGLVKNVPDGKAWKFSIEMKVAGTLVIWPQILMELITGRKAIDDTMPDDRCHLVSWFRRVIITKENIVKSIDQTLDTKNEYIIESIIKVAELAGHCTVTEPFQRPDMCHAVHLWNNGNPLNMKK